MPPENVKRVLRNMLPTIHGAIESAERAIRDATWGEIADDAVVHLLLKDYRDTRVWLDEQADVV